MSSIRSTIRKGFMTLAVIIIAATPLGTLANVSAETACTSPPASSYGPGTHQPTGSGAKAFTYQCADETNPDKPYVGQWTSERYVYYPASDSTKPLVPIVYTYNSGSGEYTFSKWVYETTSNSYRLVNRSTPTPPSNAQKVGGPAPAASAPPSTSNSSGSGSTASAAAAASSSNGSNTINNDTTNNAATTNNNSATVTNNIDSTAVTGNAMVLGNTTGGNASTGNAITQANVTNMLQSSSNALGSGAKVATFTYNIDGDVNGDLFFNPNLIKNVQGDTTVDNTLTNNLTINNTSDATINNNLTLNTQSGDAIVANNTTGGGAKTGSATSVANIINSIQSAITSGKSFVGTINITGNLNGDILLPDNFVDQLIASNTPQVSVTAPGSSNSSNSTTSNKTIVNNTNNQGVSNTVNSSAQTGTATVAGNTSAGTASSGTAKTNVTAFNLTGSKVIAKNSILVYVNVLGKWTGLIVNAPAGATAAQLGGNVTQNSSVDNTTTINNTTNQQINNDVNVNATSGDAKVRGNTSAGGATSGDARTAVNLVNIENSTFALSDWFGILYINVFGTWNGSFGMDTDAGNVATVGGKGAGGTMLLGNVSRLVRYPASTVTTHSSSPASAGTTSKTSAGPTTANPSAAAGDGTVLAAKTVAAAPIAPKKIPTQQNSTSANLWLPAIGLLLGGALYATTLRKKSTV